MESDFEGVLQGTAAFFAIFAAVFWFISARVKIPDLGDWTFDKGAEPLQKAAKWNAWAAGCAGISALTQGGILLCKLFLQSV